MMLNTRARCMRWARPLATAFWLAAMIAGAPARAGGDALASPITHHGNRGDVVLVPVPAPDLSRAEDVVRKTLDEARENLIKSVQTQGATDHELAGAYGQTGGYYLAYKLWVAAEACYANAQRLAPKDYRWPYYLGFRYQQDSQPENAARSYERALRLKPDYAPVKLRLGLVYLSLNRLDEAEPLLKAAAQGDGLRGAALYGLGRLAQMRKQPAQAVQLFEQALTQDPQASQIHYSLAMAYRALGNVDQARANLAQRGDGEPRVADPLVDALAKLLSGVRTMYYRGIEAMRDGHFDVAVQSFTQGLADDPGNVNARVTLARALYLNGDAAGAEAQLKDALTRNPHHALGLYLLGTLLEEQGKLNDAEAYYLKALAADPAQGGAHHYLANALMRSGHYAEAAKHYSAAVAADPKDTPARFMRALALIRSGHQREARDVLEVALSESPDDAMVKLALARLLAASPDDGVRDGAKALSMAQSLFDHVHSLENAEALAMAQAEVGRFKDAAALQKNALSAVAAAGRFGDVPRVQDNLDLYLAGKPCRAPWPDNDSIFYPPPMPARGPFLEYPTREAY